MAKASGAGGSVSVVYFHGMGQQRRYEESARLIERLDEYLEFRGAKDRLRKIEPRFEQSRVDPTSDPIVYVRARYRVPGSQGTPLNVRFYEAYWAPSTIDGPSSREVLWWVLRQAARPLRMLTTRWRGLERLRRADLVHYFRRGPEVESPAEARTSLKYLIEIYHRYFRMDARREFPKGRFSDFRVFLRRELRVPRKRTRPRDLERYASGWRRSHLAREWKNLLLILTFLVAVADALILLGLAVFKLLQLVPSLLPAWLDSLPFADRLQPTLPNMLAVVSLLLSALGAQRFLANYVGDVQQFCAYEEADVLHRRRRAVLRQASHVMRHVLSDASCDRVVVVAHSLGCAVALDTLLGLRQLNEADPKYSGNAMEGTVSMDKIRHFITLASPIDKISYFFSVVQSNYHRYERIIDALRGDLANVPFSKSGRQPHIHWINFWDLGDAISGPVESITPSLVREQKVDNVRLAMFHMPDPGASHSAYFEEPRVLAGLSEAIFENRYAFAHRGKDHAAPDWWGPGEGSWRQNLGMGLILLLPWLALGAILELLGWLSTGDGFSWVTVVDFMLVLAGIVSHKLGARGGSGRLKRVLEGATGA